MTDIPELQRIMLVEDEEDIRTVAELALGAVAGFDVTICCNGEEALARAPQAAPNLVLLDVMMPGMDGPTTLAHLAEMPETREIPVVMMTAKVQPREIDRYRELGAVDVIPKPFDPMTLGQQVRKIWERIHGA